MLHERQKALKQVNEMFGTKITVRLGSSWYLEHENYESLVTGVEVTTEEERENDPTNEGTDQPAPTEEERENDPTNEGTDQPAPTEERTEEPEPTEQTEQQEQQERTEEPEPTEQTKDTEEQRKKKGGKK